MKVFSDGGGVQSMAVKVLAAQGKVHYDAFLFSNVGEDSENPETLKYLEEVGKPFAFKHGLNMIELRKRMRDGSIETLAGRIFRTKRSIPIPAYMSNGAPGRRSCTSDFKIRVIAKWLKEHGATKEGPIVTGLGISLDEWYRARNDSGIDWQVLEYPLIDMRLSRFDCMQIIKNAGLPIPPRSSCFFCPFHNPREWNRIKRDQPDLFNAAIAIERKINHTRSVLKKDYVFLHRYLIPLEKLEGVQLEFDIDDGMGICESGFCMT